MLKDADFTSFAGVYLVCGYTDMRYGIDSLAAIIEQRYKMDLFVPNTLFLFCGHSASKIKGLLWEGDGFTDKTSEGIRLWQCLTVKLIDPLRGAVCRDDHQGDMLIVSLRHGRGKIEQGCATGDTNNHRLF